MSLKSARILKKYSQKEISLLLNIPLRTYKRYEKKSSEPSDFKLKLIEDKISSLPKNEKQKDLKKKSIAIIGAGNVGFPLGLALSQNHKVIFIENNIDKMEAVNKGLSPLNNFEIPEGISVKEKAYNTKNNLMFVDLAIICLPTDLEDSGNNLKTNIIEEYLQYLDEYNPGITVIIKSTVPIGFCSKANRKFKKIEIIYSPEFLREDNAWEDTLYPTRIVFGVQRKNLKNKYAALLLESVTKNSSKAMFMKYDEAESVKLFSNAYLAMRVAFINEIDSFAIKKRLNVKNIIKGFSADPRIGDYYNEPSFGYGGYCLPKDTRQLGAILKESDIIFSIQSANDKRKKLIAKQILNQAANISKNLTPKIGIYDMEKSNSALVEIVKYLNKSGASIYIYSKKDDIKAFIDNIDLLVVNRMNDKLALYKDKIYTRDLKEIR